MTKDVKEIMRGLEVMAMHCQAIQDDDGCPGCPIKYMCLDATDTSAMSLADLISAGTWQEFVDYADESHISDEDYEALAADHQRKMSIEEAMIDEEWGR